MTQRELLPEVYTHGSKDLVDIEDVSNILSEHARSFQEIDGGTLSDVLRNVVLDLQLARISKSQPLVEPAEETTGFVVRAATVVGLTVIVGLSIGIVAAVSIGLYGLLQRLWDWAS